MLPDERIGSPPRRGGRERRQERRARRRVRRGSEDEDWQEGARVRYERNGDFVVERTYEGSDSARSTWTIHPIDDSHCTLNIDASQSMGPCVGS
jgi:hypothetical protein